MNDSRIIIPEKNLYIPSEQYYPNPLKPNSIQEGGGDYEKRFIEYPKSMTWLKSLGIRLTNTRYERYLQSMDTTRKIFTFDVHNGDLNYFNSLREIDELNWIYESFEKIKVTERLKTLLKQLVTGSDFRRDDKPSSHGRNTSFHLRMAGYFARANVFTDVENPWDVSAEYQDRKIVLEAKRVSSLKKVKTRIIEAKTQIHKHSLSAENSKAFGIIAIDPYEFMFNSTEINNFKNHDDSTEKIREYFNVFGETSYIDKAKLNIKTSNAKVHLIWLNAMIPCYFEEEGYYATRFQSLFLPIKSVYTVDGQFCQGLTDYLSKHFTSPQLILAR